MTVTRFLDPKRITVSTKSSAVSARSRKPTAQLLREKKESTRAHTHDAPSNAMEVTFVFKGKSEKVTVATDGTTDAVFEAAEDALGLAEQKIKILFKGKQLQPGMPMGDSPLAGNAAAKCMVMATGAKEVSAVRAAKADATVRGFAAEDAAAAHHLAQAANSEELSEWGVRQDAKYRFCRFEPCTWQSFGTRPQSATPHGFEARALLVKLAQDPGVVSIMRAREYTVGLLAELDPIDDRHAEKMEGEGKRLLGYNQNAGAQIHIRLRTEDLSGFLPYPALVDTLLHELTHNEIGPHNEDFWHLFVQLKADYLRTLLGTSARGELFGGKSALSLAHAAEEAADVRTACLQALGRDRQVPPNELQVRLLDAYLVSTGGAGGHGATGRVLGGDTGGGDAASALSAAERREMLAAKAAARMGGVGGAGPPHAVSVAEHRGQPAEAQIPASAENEPTPGEGEEDGAKAIMDVSDDHRN